MPWIWVAFACSLESGVHTTAEQPQAKPTAPDPLTHDADHDGTVDNSDCKPYDANIYPGAGEACDGVDNDCDGKTDEADYDADNDGFDDSAACGAYDPSGTYDCDDADAGVYPGAPDDCDGRDNNCNGFPDDDDDDNDGATACDDCDPVDPFLNPDAPEACDGIDNDCNGITDDGWDEDGDGHSPCAGDCDDEDAKLYPGAGELCDGLDNDCDGVVDEDSDLDADGQAACLGDCDDTDAAVYEGATEVCDGKNTDCDATTDELADNDGDGFNLCTGDCDDESAAALPGGIETCDGVDNDCNGFWDEDPDCFGCVVSGSYALCSTATDWTTAEQACRAFGGQLVQLSTGAENDDVAALATKPTWIGATDAAIEDTWLWSDGSATSYDSWASGEPDSSGNCALTNTSGRRGDWADEPCSSAYPFVCEF